MVLTHQYFCRASDEEQRTLAAEKGGGSSRTSHAGTKDHLAEYRDKKSALGRDMVSGAASYGAPCQGHLRRSLNTHSLREWMTNKGECNKCYAFGSLRHIVSDCHVTLDEGMYT